MEEKNKEEYPWSHYLESGTSWSLPEYEEVRIPEEADPEYEEKMKELEEIWKKFMRLLKGIHLPASSEEWKGIYGSVEKKEEE